MMTRHLNLLLFILFLSSFLSSFISACTPAEPTVQKVSPVFGLTRGGEKAIIHGKSLNQLMPVTIYFGNNKVLLSSLQSPEEMWVTTPPHPTEEIVDIRIIANDGVEFIMENAFEYVRKSEMAECVNISKKLNGHAVIEQKSQRQGTRNESHSD